jgi:hypothetical protein
VGDGDLMINISSAPWGSLSTVPYGAQQQTFPYPGTVYQFDPFIIQGKNTEFDLNEAEKQLYAMMKLPATVDRCTLVIKQCDKKATCHRKRA